MRLRLAGRRRHTWMLIGILSLFLACGDDEETGPTEPDTTEEDQAAAQARATELFGKLVPVMQEAFVKLAVGGGTIEGETGGTITIADNVMTLEDFTQDGQLVLNGELTFDGAAQPPTLKGDLVGSGEAYEAPVDINVDMTVDLTADPPYGGSVTVGGVEYDVGALLAAMAAAEEG